VGASGAGAFDNDDAMDFLAELPSRGTAALQEALTEVVALGPDDYLEAPEASRAVAAAELVAAMLGAAAVDLPQEAAEWLADAQAPDPSLQASAVAALERVVSNSELAELWEDSGDDAWRTQQADLMQRVSRRV
jgi:hypothetical protein